MTASRHVASLAGSAPTFGNAHGCMQALDARSFPILDRLSIRRLVLRPLAVREPHWHANAHELGYCLRGQALVTLFGNAGARDSFTISAGEMFFVPSGTMHHIETIGDGDAEFVLAFSHALPEDFSLSSFGVMSDAVLGNTFGQPASAFAGLRRSAEPTWIGARSAPAVPDEAERHASPHKLSLEATLPPIDTAAGSARTARRAVWPALQDMAMFSVRITDAGMREPHWHPQTAEMGYVAQGRARMTVLSPGGDADTYLLGPGDAYFIPRAYPHHIEDVGAGDIHFLIFFDRDTPGDVGSKALASAYSRAVIAAAFDTTPEALPDFGFTATDPLIVGRVNPLDP